MAEFQIVLTFDENIAFAKFLTTEFRCAFNLDHAPHQSPLPTADALREALTNCAFPPLVFVTAVAWGAHPLQWVETTNNVGRRVQYISQRYGGPAFTWMLSRTLREDGQTTLIAGLFGDYPWYYVELGSAATFDRPPSMGEAYKAALAYVRANSVRSRWRQSGRPGSWIGYGALREHLNGVALGRGNVWEVPANRALQPTRRVGWSNGIAARRAAELRPLAGMKVG